MRKTSLVLLCVLVLGLAPVAWAEDPAPDSLAGLFAVLVGRRRAWHDRLADTTVVYASAR